MRLEEFYSGLQDQFERMHAKWEIFAEPVPDPVWRYDGGRRPLQVRSLSGIPDVAVRREGCTLTRGHSQCPILIA